MAGNHTRVNILVEGQTEETFVRELLAPHLTGSQVYLTPRIIETSKGHKGGVVSYGKIVHQVRRWCQHDQTAKVTTLFRAMPTRSRSMACCWRWRSDCRPSAKNVCGLISG